MSELLPVKLIFGSVGILVALIALGVVFLIIYSIFKFLFQKKLLKTK